MKAFLTIKEFSRLSGVEGSTLRYWDEIGLFSPAKRDPTNNYRYYSAEQIIIVNHIKVLSDLNVPLKMIREMGKSRTPESIVHLIEQQEKLLDMEMRKLRECYSIIHTRREAINNGRAVLGDFGNTGGENMTNINKISVVHRQAVNIILGSRNTFRNGEGFYGPFTRFCKQSKDLRINLSFPIGALHDDWNGFIDTPGEPHYFFSTDPTGNKKLDAGDYVVGFIRGYYGQFGDLPERMANYIKKHGLKVTGPTYTFYLHDEVCVKNSDGYLAQICVAVSK